jgi:hypothetical protein
MKRLAAIGARYIVIALAPRLFLFLTAVFATCLTAGPAAAAVELSFYSRELGGNNFPHAFVTMKGQPDAGGPPVDISYGFTVKALSPAVLMGSVGGKVMNEPPAYVAKSDRQFTLTLPDDRFRAVMAVIDRWTAKAQPSYNLNKSNCIHFVAEVAQAAGLKVEFRKELMKKPRSFLLAVKAQNADLIAAGRAPPLGAQGAISGGRPSSPS